MKLSTPENVQKLRTALYERAKREPELRFYSLYDKVHRVDVLGYAFALCRANKGAAGPDRVTFEDIEKSGGPGPMLARLAEELRTKKPRTLWNLDRFVLARIARWSRHKHVRRLPAWSLARGGPLYREYGLVTWWRRKQPR